jgi:valyl-tRNA synthetase
MVADFPVADQDFVDTDADKQFEIVFAAIRSIRSLGAQYHLQSNLKATLLSTAPSEAEMLKTQVPTIVTLTKGCQSVAVVEQTSDIPEGCGSVVLSPTLTSFLLVKGMIDIEAEISKCEKKLELANLNADKARKLLSQPGNLPEAVRSTNQEKLLTIEAEIANLQQSKEMFQKLA